VPLLLPYLACCTLSLSQTAGIATAGGPDDSANQFVWDGETDPEVQLDPEVNVGGATCTVAGWQMAHVKEGQELGTSRRACRPYGCFALFECVSGWCHRLTAPCG
jgi:hypothetical protein